MSDERPSLPADLRRKILLEAGHRCAIPTCQQPLVEVHHIVPWKSCREHTYDNLIALCPNCHRRAERGEIDRRSLLEYKNRLAKLFGPALKVPTVFETRSRVYINSTTMPMSTSTYSAVNDNPSYDVQIDYPQFSDKALREVNQLIVNLIESQAKLLLDAALSPDRYVSFPFSMMGSFVVVHYTPSLLSLRFTFSSYSGGAHGGTNTEVVNYCSERGAVLPLNGLFASPEVGIANLSAYCISALLSEDHRTRNRSNVERGAGPDASNFEMFNLSTEGILLTFDEYQVGCYAEGRSEVLVPYAVMRPFLSDYMESLITRYGGTEV